MSILLVKTVAPETGSVVQQPVLRANAPMTTALPVPPATRRFTSLWPLMGSFLRWAGMELAPRLVDVALEVWSCRTAGDRLSRVGGLGTVFASRPWRHRRRRRGR